MSVSEQAAAVVASVTESAGGDKALAGQILRKAAKLGTPANDPAAVSAACAKALEEFGTVTVRLAAKSTGFSLRKCREALGALGTAVDKDTFTAA